MPPKKAAKQVQARGSEAEDLIEEYLVSQYKPFAINDIVQNLHNKVAKTAAVKALESLASAGRITTKSFGKIVIYACNEKELELPEGVQESEYRPETLAQWRNELAEVEKDYLQAQEAWQKVAREPTNEELPRLIKQNCQTAQQLRDKLSELQTNWEPQDEVVVERLMTVEAQVDKQLKLRARLVQNLLALIKDSVRPSNMAEFLVSTVELPGFAACSNTNSLIGRYRF